MICSCQQRCDRMRCVKSSFPLLPNHSGQGGLFSRSVLASLSNSAPPEFRYSTVEGDKRSARDPLAIARQSSHSLLPRRDDQQ